MSKGIVLIDTESGTENDVLEELKEFKEVEEVYIVYGHHDLIANIEAENIKELRDIVCRIRKIDAVYATSTMVVK